MSKQVKGTQVFVIDTLASSPTVKSPSCITTLTINLPPIIAVIEECLDTGRAEEPGDFDIGEATLSLAYDESDESHTLLEDLYLAKVKTWFIIGKSDGTSDPTIGSGGDPVMTGRSGSAILGYISAMSEEFPAGQRVTRNATIRYDGNSYTPFRKTGSE